jgi:hypothetical protein
LTRLAGAVDRDAAKNYCCRRHRQADATRIRRHRQAKGFEKLPKSARLLPWSRPAPAIGVLVASALLAALAGCGGGQEQASSSEAATGHLFARGIEQISDLYIEPISSRKLVTVGAMNLSKLDDNLGVTIGGDVRDRDRLALTYQGNELLAVRLPAEISGADGGEIIARLVAAARRASPRIAAMPEDAIDRAIFDGMTGMLDRFSRYSPPE